MEKKDTSALQEQLKLQVLRNNLDNEKKIIERFLEDKVCGPLIVKIQEIIQSLSGRLQELNNKPTRSYPEQNEFRNLQALFKRSDTLRGCQYWQLLPFLYKFPGQYQIGMDTTLLQDLQTSVHFKEVNHFIPIGSYIQNRWSFKRFLTDCIAFARLRRLQLKYMAEISPGQSPIEKASTMEKEFAILPDNFLLERRLASYDHVRVYKGMDLAKNVPVIIKFLSQDTSSNFHGMDYSEAKRRFEREAQAYEKLERHFIAKEQAAAMLAEQGQKKIEEGNKKGNREKVKAGEALIKQSEELFCHRYFVKAYCLATGELSYFHVGNGFYREPSQTVAFIVMEYVEGADLKVLLEEYRSKKTPIPMKVFIPIFQGILEALEYCHNEGIIHRDIRPENILITENFRVRLTNLGRAKVEDMTQLTGQNAFVGTPGYAAPEGIVQGITIKDRNLEKLVTQTDNRFDLYSVGCVAYEILTGRSPFTSNKKTEDEQSEEILLKHLKEIPVAISQIRKDVPETISRLVMKLLEKKPIDRFSSAKDTLQFFQATLSLGQKAGEYTQRLLEKLQPSRQETAYQPVKSLWLPRIAASLVILLVISSPFVYIFWEDLLPVMKKFRETSKQQWQEFWRKDKKEREEVLRILDKLSQYYSNVDQKHQENTQWYETLVKEFPPEQGYRSTDEIIPILLQRSTAKLERLDKIIKTCRNTNENNGVQALKDIGPYENYDVKNPEIAELVQRVHTNLKQIYELNYRQRETEQQRNRMMQVAYGFRNALFSVHEQLGLIHERLSILQTRFPESSEDVATLDNFEGKLQECQQAIQALDSNIHNIQSSALVMDNSSFEELIRPHQKFQNTLDTLTDLANQLDRILTLSKQNQAKREQEELLIQVDKVLSERQNKLESVRVSAYSVWQEAQKTIKVSNTIPNVLVRAEEEKKQMIALQKQFFDYRTQNKTQEALQLAKQILDSHESPLYEELYSYRQSLEDQIRIAEAAEKQKQDAERQKQISTILTQTKTQFQRLSNAYSACQEEYDLLASKYPKEIARIPTSKKVLLEGKKKYDNFAAFLKSVEAKIIAKDLTQAYQMLIQRQKETPTIDKNVKDLLDAKSSINKFYVYAEKNDKGKAILARCNLILQRLNANLAIMESQLNEVNDSVKKLQIEFPKQQGYPQITTSIGKVIADANQSYQDYQTQIKSAQDAIARQDYVKALNILAPFEGQRLDGYAKFSNALPDIQQDIARVKVQGPMYRKNYDKLSQVREYELVVINQKRQLEEKVPLLESRIRELQPYAGKTGYRSLNPIAEKSIIDAKAEIEELDLVLKKSQEYVQNQQYFQAENKLKCYDQDYLRQSKLNTIHALLQESDDSIAFNKLLEQDKTILEKSIRETQEREMAERRLKTLQRPPGPWFSQVMQLSQTYNSLEKSILSCIEDSKGSIKIYEIIQRNWLEIADYPKDMAVLGDLERIILANPRAKIPQMGRSPKEDVFLKAYWNMGKNISPDITEEIQIIQETILTIQSEMRGLWVKEDTLRKLKSAQDSLDRKFREIYEDVHSVLENLANQR